MIEDFALTADRAAAEAEVIPSWQGIVIGVSVAAPIGPMAILCVRRSVMFDRSVGMATGMGIASAHALYSAFAVVVLQGAATILGTHSVVLRAVNATILVGLGIRMVCTQPSREHGHVRQLSPKSAYTSAFGLGLANPLTVLSLASLLASSDLSAVQTAPAAVMLIAGVFAGSSLWWLLVTRSATLFATRLTTRALVTLHRIAGPSLMASAASLAFR